MRNYGDIFTRKPTTPTYPTQPATLGEVVEVLADGYVGAIVGHEKTYDATLSGSKTTKGKPAFSNSGPARSSSTAFAPPSPNPNQQLGPNAPTPAPTGW